MRRAFVIVWFAVLAALLLSHGWLPEQVGSPGKQAPRALYLALMVLVLSHAWLCSHRFIEWIGRTSPDLLNLPHKAYWMAPERRAATVERMATHTSALGFQVVVLVAGLHARAVLEGQPSWPQPPEALWQFATALLAVAFVAWVWRCYRMFPAPPTASPPSQAPRRPRRPGERD